MPCLKPARSVLFSSRGKSGHRTWGEQACCLGGASSGRRERVWAGRGAPPTARPAWPAVAATGSAVVCEKWVAPTRPQREPVRQGALCQASRRSMSVCLPPHAAGRSFPGAPYSQIRPKHRADERALQRGSWRTLRNQAAESTPERMQARPAKSPEPSSSLWPRLTDHANVSPNL